MKVRVVYKLDGTVAVIHYAPDGVLTYDKAMAKCMEGELEGLEFDDIEEDALPQTREYRDAWRGQKGVGVTLDAAEVAEIDLKLVEKVAKAKERAALIDARANETDPDVKVELQRLLVELEATLIDVARER